MCGNAGWRLCLFPPSYIASGSSHSRFVKGEKGMGMPRVSISMVVTDIVEDATKTPVDDMLF